MESADFKFVLKQTKGSYKTEQQHHTDKSYRQYQNGVNDYRFRKSKNYNDR